MADMKSHRYAAWILNGAVCIALALLGGFLWQQFFAAAQYPALRVLAVAAGYFVIVTLGILARTLIAKCPND